MKKKIRLLAAAVLGVFMMGGTAKGASITFDPDGAGSATALQNVIAFDFSPGNALAANGAVLIPDGATGTLGTVPYQQLFHASLATIRVENPDGSTTDIAASTYGDYTVIVGFTGLATLTAPNANERQVGLSLLTPTGSFVRIYHDAGDNSNDLTGVGFNDGTLILSATVTNVNGSIRLARSPVGNLDQVGTDNYPDVDTHPTIAGSSFRLSALVDAGSTPNAYFVNAAPTQVGFAFTTGESSLPFTPSPNPSAAFYSNPGLGTGIPDYIVHAGPLHTTGTVNAGRLFGNPLGGPDIQFRTDSEATFALVPTPGAASMALLMLTVLGTSRVRRRR